MKDNYFKKTESFQVLIAVYVEVDWIIHDFFPINATLEKLTCEPLETSVYNYKNGMKLVKEKRLGSILLCWSSFCDSSTVFCFL